MPTPCANPKRTKLFWAFHETIKKQLNTHEKITD